MRAENFCGVKNQFVIHTKKAIVFQSYETPIAVYDRESGIVYVDEKKYSRTTSKYLNSFLDWLPYPIKKEVTADEIEAIVEEM